MSLCKGTHRRQMRASELLELKLQITVSLQKGVLGTELGSSVRASALNCKPICQTPLEAFFQQQYFLNIQIK